METVELVVYLALAVILGGLIIAFIGGWDARSAYEGMKTFFAGDDPVEYEQITSDELPRAALDLWEACGLGGAEMSKTVYVTDGAPMNKSMIFERVRAYNLCKTLQSAEFGCGSDEDVAFAGAVGPVVLSLRCDPDEGKLLIMS